jgi:hypothetical protein
MNKKLPFFARCLEKQELDEVSGGGRRGTGKSRNDELVAVTLKYPSDGEDSDPGLILETKKYPSDSDESEVL